MPVVKGQIDDKTVDVLRDTGCSGIVVKKSSSRKNSTQVTLTVCC